MQMNINRFKNKDTANVAGQYRMIKLKPGTFKQMKPGKLFVPKQKDIIEVGPWIENKIMKDTNKGINLWVQRLTGVKTYDDEITSAEIGTGVLVPADTTANLVTPVLTGILRSNQSYTITVATIQFFIADVELPNGTYKEFLLRCGTQAFAASVITPNYSKASGQDTIVEYAITLNNT